jgi:predicted CxxxxCH...CXXCH cytochrome family protein
VGAHQTHLAGSNLRRPIACTECHDVPTVVAHADAVVDLAFGTLATTGGAAPAFVSASLRCGGVYCHGATLTGGTNVAPQWTAVNGREAECGACHGVPPPPPHSQSKDCGGCHPGYTSTSVLVAEHVDGVVQALATCTSCHGDPARPEAIAAAPPRDVAGNTATTFAGVGAHQRHLQGGSVRPALACTECHDVPASLATHPDETVDVAFGPLARGSGASPTWSATTSSCANTYCHGATLLGGTARTPVWTRVDGSQIGCTGCHGMPPRSSAHSAVANGASCAPCHAGYTASAVNSATHVDGMVDAAASCTSCHGDPSRAGPAAAAPPRDTRSNVSTTARGVGAHQAHLAGGLLRAGIACTECHAVPATLASHPDSSLGLVWGPLARGGGAVPSWNGAALTCSNYCHGATLAGGSDITPTWNVVNGTHAACGACHGVPPPAPHAASSACGGCHAGYTSTTVNLTTHVDGQIQASAMTCTSCHGDPARTLVVGADAQAKAAPPADTRGGAAATLRGVGAHLAHLNRSTGAIASPTACAECHVVPSSQTHANGAVGVTFGTRARTGGVTPTWNGSTCANTYCHGSHPNGTSSTPSWTSTAKLACTACHAMPPQTQGHSFRHEPSSGGCSGCHKAVDSTGTRIVKASLHVNGRVDGQCLDCHKSVPRI